MAAGKWDLWLGTTLIGDDLAAAQMTSGLNIDSFMFYGQSSAGNVGVANLDNITYGTDFAAVPEPMNRTLALCSSCCAAGAR